LSYSTLCSLSQVSRLFNQLASHNYLWLKQMKNENFIETNDIFQNEKFKFKYLFENALIKEAWKTVRETSGTTTWLGYMYLPSRSSRYIYLTKTIQNTRENILIIIKNQQIVINEKWPKFNNRLVRCSNCSRIAIFNEPMVVVHNWWIKYLNNEEEETNEYIEIYCTYCQRYSLWKHIYFELTGVKVQRLVTDLKR
ncbi:unnamed protein product, partial [Didymodactylos carnosus]